METRAYLKGTRLSPQKAGLVADVIRGKSIQEAMDFLSFSKKKGSEVMKKLLESAIANAENEQYGTKEELVISTIYADQSTVIKRWRARARGRAGTFNRPQSHIFVELSDNTMVEES